MIEHYHPQHILPSEWRIKYAGQHFYRYGFSPIINGCTHRPKIYHPVLVSVVISALLIKFIYSVVTPIKTTEFHLYMGDFGYFMGMKFHINIIASILFCLALLSLFLHYYEYLCGKGQTYMKIFLMMSGQITPESIGITDENLIRDILMKTRIAFKCNDFFRLSVYFVGFMANFTSYLLKDSSLKTVIIAFLHSSIASLGAQYVINILCTQISYFYLICYYLKLKQREVNNYLRKVIENKERIKIFNSNQMIAKLNKIYEEIKECDSVFWSKFLALVWALFTGDTAFMIYVVSFS